MARIKNINGTPLHTYSCNCDSWLQHWENNGGGQRPTFCIISHPDCLGKATKAAFVQKANTSDDKWYLAPVCNAHYNSPNTEFTVYDTWALIEVDPVAVCERKKKNKPEEISVVD